MCDSNFPRLDVTVKSVTSRGSKSGRMVEKQRIKAKLMTASEKLAIDYFSLPSIVMHREVVSKVVM